MSDKKHYDVIIIGAGSVGLPAALKLAEKNARVLVVDKFASPGQGANKAAIGGVRATHSDPAKIRLGLRSLEILKSWKETYGDELDWHTGGYSFVAYREKEKATLQTLLETQKKYGLNIDWYEKGDLLKIVPGLNPEGLLGGTFSPDDGFCSNLLTNHAYFVQCKKAGADFLFNHEISEILIKNGKVKGVIANEKEFLANTLINAAGPWAKQVGQMAGLDHPVNPDSHEAGITEPVSLFVEPMIIDIRPAPGSANAYFYQQKTGQITFCYTPDPNIWGYNTEETSNFLPNAAKRLISLMPKLGNIRVRRTWRGLYPMTPDGFPVCGWMKELQGYFVTIGLCGQGFMLGPALGEWTARMILNQLEPEDQMIAESFSPYREFTGKETLK